MSIIDRYLLRQFVQTFLICYLSLTGLYIIFDAFTNLEEFLRVADKCGGLAKLMVTHYGYRSILFFDRTSGLLALVAAMFTVAWIQRHNELTALLAAGVSRIRVVKPIIAAVVVIAFTATKELFPVRIAGTSVGAINLFPFAGGAVFQPFLGQVLERFGGSAEAYSAAGYKAMFTVCFAAALGALAAISFMKETLSAGPTE